MKLLLDSSVIVEIERRRVEALTLIKKLVERQETILISTISVSEVLTGAYLLSDAKQAVNEARLLLEQFIFLDVNADVAEKAAQYRAYLIRAGKTVEHPDTLIAATATMSECDYLLTMNKRHFEAILELKGKVCNPAEFARVLERKRH